MLRPGPLLGWFAALSLAGWILAGSTRAALRPGQVVGAAATPDAAVVAASVVIGWLILGWLIVVVSASVAEAVGLAGAHAVAALAPRAIRTAIRTSIGLGVATGTLVVAAPAGADDSSTQHWPSLDRPAAPAHEPAVLTYSVRPDDCLWTIAQAHLPRGASAADVAREWPRWWRANRATIGPDPGLIRPGQVLRVPAGRP